MPFFYIFILFLVSIFSFIPLHLPINGPSSPLSSTPFYSSSSFETLITFLCLLALNTQPLSFLSLLLNLSAMNYCHYWCFSFLHSPLILRRLLFPSTHIFHRFSFFSSFLNLTLIILTSSNSSSHHLSFLTSFLHPPIITYPSSPSFYTQSSLTPLSFRSTATHLHSLLPFTAIYHRYLAFSSLLHPPIITLLLHLHFHSRLPSTLTRHHFLSSSPFYTHTHHHHLRLSMHPIYTRPSSTPQHDDGFTTLGRVFWS